MTPEQALGILDRATSLAPLTREEHNAVIQALTKIRDIISPPTKTDAKADAKADA